MGPILIFDKSAIQCFSIDESVWLNNFFLINITPVFFVETLADLSKTSSSRRSTEIISEIAAKTQNVIPNIHHSRLILGNLLGVPVDTRYGRPIIDRGETKQSPDGKIGVHFEEAHEAKALQRWHEGKYYQVEREFARQWRQLLDNLDFETAIGIAINTVPKNEKLNTLEQIYDFVNFLIERSSLEMLYLLFHFLGIQKDHQSKILARWKSENEPTLVDFAPYAAYVTSIDLFFYIAAGRGLISKERTSNKVDLSYLYYLPFCQVFVSGDKLHARTVPLFLREDQNFIKSDELKDALKQADTYYEQFQDEIQQVGVMQFTSYPPVDFQSPLQQLWDTHCPGWRNNVANKSEQRKKNVDTEELLKHLKETSNQSRPVDPNVIKTMDEADHVIMKHSMPVQRGKWRILPQGIENKKK